MMHKSSFTLEAGFGVVLMLLIGLGAMLLAKVPWLSGAGVSPLTLAIIMGILIGNLHLVRATGEMEKGIHFVQKRVLRLGIILYGFRITFQEILGVGLSGFLVVLLVVTLTFLVGTYTGVRWFKMDRETAMLSASGSSICGAAAVIATEGVVNGGPRKTAVAVSTVVLFGTISMFLYPLLYSISWMTPEGFGVYIGSTIHEVAQVVVAGEALDDRVASTAVIVKMTRVMLLAPFLVILGWWISRRRSPTINDPENDSLSEKKHQPVEHSQNRTSDQIPVLIPWFALGFIGVSAFNSLNYLPADLVEFINLFDTLILSAAMAALGMGTILSKMKGVGWGPLLHGLFLFGFLVVVGYGINRLVSG